MGHWIRKRRLDSGLTQLQVARLLGVTECCVTNWELNRTEPEIRYLPRIIDFVGYCPYVPTVSAIETWKQVRRALGLSLKDLAKTLALDPSNLQRLESGLGTPTRKTQEALRSFVRSAADR